MSSISQSNLSTFLATEKEFNLALQRYQSLTREYTLAVNSQSPNRNVIKALGSELNELNMRLVSFANKMKGLVKTTYASNTEPNLIKIRSMNGNLNDLIVRLKLQEQEYLREEAAYKDSEGLHALTKKQTRSSNFQYIGLLLLAIFLIFVLVSSLFSTSETQLERITFGIIMLITLIFVGKWLYFKYS
jgi:hypothetical protein